MTPAPVVGIVLRRRSASQAEAHRGDAPLPRQAAPVKLDPLNLVQRLRGHVALPAVRAGHDRNALDDQQRRAPSERTGQSALQDSRLSADGAALPRFLHHVQSVYTVRMTTRPVGPNLATTTTESSPSSGRPRITYFRSPHGRSD